MDNCLDGEFLQYTISGLASCFALARGTHFGLPIPERSKSNGVRNEPVDSITSRLA